MQKQTSNGVIARVILTPVMMKEKKTQLHGIFMAESFFYPE